MARDFPGTAGNAFTCAGGPFEIGTWTVAGWAWLDTAPGGGQCMVTHQYSATHLPMVLGIGDGSSLGTAGRWGVGHYRADAGWYALSDTAAAPTGAWTHVCGTLAGTAAQIFRNGTKTNTTTFGNAAAASGLQFRVGRRWDAEGTASAHIDGRLAHVAVWNVVLSDAEVAALAAGVNPFLVRPTSQLAYWPLWGNEVPERDWRGGDSPLTQVGTVAGVALNPPIRSPIIPAAGY